MSSGFKERILIFQLALLFVSMVVVSGCWIPLPEETAIVVEVFDGQGNPVDGVELLLDGTDTIVTGSRNNEGQVFVSLNRGGDHTLQLYTATLIDPQGGIGWMPLASQISGERLPLSYLYRPFAGGSDVLIVPVNKGEITVATIYLDDIHKSPMDNQWLTDGSNPSPYRPDDNTDEFRDNPEPVFWWRTDPSLGTTVTYTFQLWEDDDADTRFPLGVIDHAQYNTAMDSTNASYIQPDWQVPLAGVQRAEASGVNQVTLWSSEATESPVKYDLYYAPATQWTGTDWEKFPVVRDITDEGVLDGVAINFTIGNGTTNPGVVLKNGIEYTLGLRARDAASNLDTTGPISTRRATPPGSGSSLGAVSIISAVADSTIGGQIDLDLTCQPGDDLRVYAAPSGDFNDRPYDIRFIRDIYTCGFPYSYSLTDLVNGVTYAVGLEPFDASWNVGTAATVWTATPSSASSVSDTTAPFFLGTPLTVDTIGLNPGQVRLTIAAAADSISPVIRRVSWSPASFTNDPEAMLFIDLNDSPVATTILSDIPNQIPFNYAVRAIDDYGNVSAVFNSQVTLSEADSTGPTWASDVPAFYTTFSYSMGGTVWPLGATWSYGSAAAGFALGLDPVQGQGEYVWRVIQDNPVRGVTVETKLSAFYTYSGYYYASTESGGLSMSSPSSNAYHLSVLNFIERGILAADVMDSPFDSSNPDGYRQRTAALYTDDLETGFGKTNQIFIFYPTDAEGEASVSQLLSNGNVVTFIDVFLQNKQSFVTPSPPHHQGKTLQLAFETPPGDQFLSPFPFSSEDLLYFGNLNDPDYMDPLW